MYRWHKWDTSNTDSDTDDFHTIDHNLLAQSKTDPDTLSMDGAAGSDSDGMMQALRAMVVRLHSPEERVKAMEEREFKK